MITFNLFDTVLHLGSLKSLLSSNSTFSQLTIGIRAVAKTTTRNAYASGNNKKSRMILS